MKLARYLVLMKLTQAEFAARVGVSRSTVSLWINRRTIPYRAKMAAIERATRGAVTPADFRRRR